MSNKDMIRALMPKYNPLATARRKTAEKFSKTQRERVMAEAKRTKRVKRVNYNELSKKANDQNSETHWSDSSKYADEHYGDRMREINKYDTDWN